MRKHCKRSLGFFSGLAMLGFSLLLFPLVAFATPGVCGSANGASFTSQPTNNLCSYGTPSAVSGSGPWTWTCNSSGHPPTPCSANLAVQAIDGQCGSADGKTFDNQPTSNLCSTGTATRVNGSGPWTWSCLGQEGGTDAQCSADKTAPPACGNGVKESGEACDDGNNRSGDGCSSQCRVESCGDGTVDVGESCDDGNTTNGDGCNASCSIEGTPQPKDPKEDKDDDDCDGSIGNFIWHDQNGDGVQDKGESGIAGVEVWLYHGNDVKKDRTDKNGEYEFHNLCEGSYRLAVKTETIGNKTLTADPDNTRDHMTKVTLDNDERHAKADFGYKGLIAPATGPGLAVIALSAVITIIAVAVIVKMLSRKKSAGSA